MRHALDADHVIAVTAIVSRERSLVRAARVGVWWGVGHSATIFTVGGAIIALRLTVAPRVGLAFEFGVALMLITLGALNIWRAQDDVPSVASTMPPLVIGIVHGLAGSAAIALVVLATIRDPVQGAVYLLVFGAGTIVGMMAVTSAIAASALAATRRVPAMRRYVRLGAGALSLVFGLTLAREIGVERQLFGATPVWSPK